VFYLRVYAVEQLSLVCYCLYKLNIRVEITSCDRLSVECPSLLLFHSLQNGHLPSLAIISKESREAAAAKEEERKALIREHRKTERELAKKGKKEFHIKKCKAIWGGNFMVGKERSSYDAIECLNQSFVVNVCRYNGQHAG